MRTSVAVKQGDSSHFECKNSGTVLYSPPVETLRRSLVATQTWSPANPLSQLRQATVTRALSQGHFSQRKRPGPDTVGGAWLRHRVGAKERYSHKGSECLAWYPALPLQCHLTCFDCKRHDLFHLSCRTSSLAICGEPESRLCLHHQRDSLVALLTFPPVDVLWLYSDSSSEMESSKAPGMVDA